MGRRRRAALALTLVPDHATWTSTMEPDLQAQLRQVRAPFARVYDAMYRLERMLRYAHWLRAREHAPRNLLGSWTEADITAEIELWRSFQKRRFDESEVADEIVRRLQDEYDQCVDDALQDTTDPALATNGLPIWNPDVDALVPQTLDVLRICKAIVDQPDPLGRTYTYRYPDAPAVASLIFYPKQWIGIAPALDDPRMADAFAGAAADMMELAENRGAKPIDSIGPEEERLEGEEGIVQQVVTQLVRYANPDGSGMDEYLTMAGFRGRYFKMRLTLPSAAQDDRPEWLDVQRFNSDLATFLAFYGP